MVEASDHVEQSRMRRMDAQAVAAWRHPLDPRRSTPAGRKGPEAAMMKGLVNVVVAPVVWGGRRGVREGYAAFLIVVRAADPGRLRFVSDADLARAMGLELKEYRARSLELYAVSADAQAASEFLRLVLDTVLPAASRCGGWRRWQAGFRALVCLFYVVSPEAFEGLTRRQLGRRLGLQWSRLMEVFAEMERWLAGRRKL